jgi:PleD family two-component response regulator
MKKWILIVDDNEMMREFLSHILSKNYLTTQAISCEDALDQLSKDELPDMVLTDFSMSGKTGLDLLKEVKGTPHTSHIPVMLLSSNDKSHYRIDCFAEGADDYVIKPFNPVQLQLRIERVINAAVVTKN